MKQHLFKKVKLGQLVSSILIICLVLSSCVTSAKIEHTNIKFSEISYTRPDVNVLDEKIEQATKLAKEGNESVFSLYDEIMEIDKGLTSDYTLANLYGSLDVNDKFYQEEQVFLDDYSVKLSNKLIALTSAILENENLSSEAQKKWGKDFIDRFNVNKKLNDPKIEQFANPKTILLNEYKELNIKEYTREVDGEKLNMDTLYKLYFEKGDEVYREKILSIFEQQNKDMGTIYLELAKYWEQEATILNFDSIADYHYASLNRDFTKEEATRLSKDVVKFIVPLYQEISTKYSDILYMENDLEFDYAMEVLEKQLKKGYPSEMSEALKYMKTNEMYDFSESPKKTQGAFATIINKYNAPYMFINPASTTPETIFHEFGHYTNFYMSAPYMWNDNQSLDLAEVHSQGLELLSHDSYDELYGEQAEERKIINIYKILGAVLQGFCEDAFQQQALSSKDRTLDNLNKIHASVTKEFLGYEDYYQWALINHHFETPFYYVSYGTSALAALNIWDMAQDNRPKAMSTYSKLLTYNYNSDFRETLDKVGLEDPFKEGYVEDLANSLRKAFGLDNALDNAA